MSDRRPLPKAITELHVAGVLGALDVEFARVLARIQHGDDDVLLAGALTSRAVQRGHVCLDLRGLDQRVLLDQEEQPVEVELPALKSWLTRLNQSALVACPKGGLRPSPAEHRPLVLDPQGRVYLWRYYDYQTRLAENLLQRFERAVAVDEVELRQSLTRLFGDSREDPDLQRVAALISASSAFSLVSGGPGTGKTTTVVRILATIVEQARALGKDPPRTLLLAPTGKAAQRLAEAITAQKTQLKCEPWVLEQIPTEAQTIHRALGYQPHSPTRFRHNASEPLSADCVLVDESSMVDLALLTKLVEAVPTHAQLILMGDKDQLSSVETGAILGDLFNPSLLTGHSPALVSRVAALSGDRLPKPKPQRGPKPRAWLADCMVHLSKSYRYSSQGGIGALARAINAGEPRAVWSACQGPDGVAFSAGAAEELEPSLAALAVAGFRGYLEAREPEQKLRELARFRLLTAHRRGRLGVEHLNQLCERALVEAGLIRPFSSNQQRASWYPGQPVMVTQNDYSLGLFNGDVGVVARATDGQLRAWFLGAKSSADALRGILPARLPAHETVYAMTVHKSQGSEFDDVVLVLPPKPSPILTRELIYTAVTRAKHSVHLAGQRSVLEVGVTQRIRRASGLSEMLWGFELPEAASSLPTAQRQAEQLELPFE
ncbi:MAG: exodeoxyribonuclease V subunit alpha [Myxococcales bacterium]|nr:exodeoxyribonuclease V subunit alpha [Myxococcales bacterium]